MNTLRYPPSVDWEMTSACNHNCIHCYNFWRKKTGRKCTQPNKQYYLQCARKLIESTPVSVQITGGEPLLVWDQIKDALQMLLEAGIHVSLNTNATLMTDKIAQFLADNQMDAFVSFPCARADIFDCIVNQKGAAVRAETGIQKMLDHGVRVSLNMVVTKLNLPYVYETACYVRDIFHVSYFSATKASFPQNADESFRSQMLDHGEFNEMLQVLLRVKREFGMRVDSAWVYSLCGFVDECVMDTFGFNRKCACGRYNFVLDAFGNIKACGCDSTNYGNILQDSFETAISRMSEWQDASLLAPECKTCSALKYCGGGCRADGRGTHGSYCTLDSTADLTNYGRHVSERGKLFPYDDDFTVELRSDAKMVRENGCVRISYKTNFEFISQQFADFITDKETFNVAQLRTACGQPDSQIYHCLQKLLHKGLLQRCFVSSKDLYINKGIFTLMYSPYVPEDASQLIRDYAGYENSNKRFY